MASSASAKTHICGFPRERLPLPQHEILHYLRGKLESSHRDNLHRYSTTMPYLLEPSIDWDAASLSPEQADECCNKTVPIFICSSRRYGPIPVLRFALHNWLYRKWFRPYESDIEYGQFFAKTIQPRGISVDATPNELIPQVIRLHKNICHSAQQVRQSWIDFDLSQPFNRSLQGILAWKPLESVIEDQKYFILQPIFEALAIIVLDDDYSVEIADLGQLRVWIACTGQTNGLSAPITLDALVNTALETLRDSDGQLVAIVITLDAAYTFISNLERREAAIFGKQPDPVESTKDLKGGYLAGASGLMEDARNLGWEDEVLQGPSSLWVDKSIYTEWTGNGAWYDKHVSQYWEGVFRKQTSELALRSSGEYSNTSAN